MSVSQDGLPDNSLPISERLVSQLDRLLNGM